uniref:Uncharacterized protein n=1 Tax=Rhizophora mucronata TaxID=61149 RepID=A0A2P2KM33_RHIMU
MLGSMFLEGNIRIMCNLSYLLVDLVVGRKEITKMTTLEVTNGCSQVSTNIIIDQLLPVVFLLPLWDRVDYDAI